LTFPDVASSSTASTTTLSATDVGPRTNPTSNHRHRAVHLGPPRAFRERHNPCDRRVGAPLPAQASTCRQAVGALDVGLVAPATKAGAKTTSKGRSDTEDASGGDINHPCTAPPPRTGSGWAAAVWTERAASRLQWLEMAKP
jgi:hypothetical protein